jgi:hypothetical protein
MKDFVMALFSCRLALTVLLESRFRVGALYDVAGTGASEKLPQRIYAGAGETLNLNFFVK